MSREMCKRFDKLRHDVSFDIATLLMNDEIDFDMERSGLFEKLRQLVASPDGSLHTMHQVCDYVYWAKESHLDLIFELSDEEYRRCLIVKEKGVYAEFLAHEELTALPVYQLMKQLSELASIVAGDLPWQEAKIITEYLDVDSRATFPKFLLYSTH